MNNNFHRVPFFSQKNHISSHSWKDRGCGIVALKMLFEYWHAKDNRNKTVALNTLLKSGVAKNAFIKDVGWSHPGLISVARVYDYDGFNKDLVLSKASARQALKQLKKDLEYFPIMVSVWRNTKPTPSGGHLVIISAIKNGRVYINDPLEINAKLGQKTLAEKEFLKIFKRRYIAVYPAGFISRNEKMKIFNVDIGQSYLAMIRNSVGTKMFRNLYVKLPTGKKDVLENGNRSCVVFVSSVLYQWGLIADIHANTDPIIKDMLDLGWQRVKTPRQGCVIEWEIKKINGRFNKHIGFYLGNNKAISSRIEKGVPMVHHWTYGKDKNGNPNRKIIGLYWHHKLENK